MTHITCRKFIDGKFFLHWFTLPKQIKLFETLEGVINFTSKRKRKYLKEHKLMVEENVPEYTLKSIKNIMSKIILIIQ